MSNFDEALERFHQGDLEYAGGLANHGPMGAEALEQLGHQALIPAFLGLYAPRLPIAGSGSVLSNSETRAALGDVSRGSDWVATFESRLAEGDWRAVVARDVPPLMPGIFSGAGHGFLRTAHAVRSLEGEDSPLRRRELARGLAYWSARYQPLPGRPGSGETPALALEDDFSSWPLVREPESRSGIFFEAIRRLDNFPAFSAAIERFERPGPEDLNAFLSSLCRIAAATYLAHPDARIPYVHMLTIPSAVRLVAPLLEEQDVCLSAAYAFQAMAAMHSLFGEGLAIPEPEEEVGRVAKDWDEIRYHAARSIQEHSIKMTEACWREDRRAPDPIFRRAAADAALRIDGRGQASTC